LDVSKDTVRSALLMIEQEGVLTGMGHGRRRAVVSPEKAVSARRTLRVVILFRDPLVEQNSSMQRLLLQLQRRVEGAGHACIFAPKSQSELNSSVPRIARMVHAMQGDAWVVVGGDLELLHWFAAQPLPAMALGGRQGAALAGTGVDGVPLLRAVTKQLVGLGHRRIVMVCPRAWRVPFRSRVVESFLEELSACGVATGDYNVPDWEPTQEGVQALLESLFQLTPPTALILEEPAHVVATITHLAQRRMRVPQEVSLISMGREAALAWCRPEISYFDWDNELLVRRISRWVSAVAGGKADRETISFPLKFIPGATIGPPPAWAWSV
jgi:DNA-binding LacI/PurR family transcriptional regulator